MCNFLLQTGQQVASAFGSSLTAAIEKGCNEAATS